MSTFGQNEAGQKREISRWLAGHGFTDVRWYIDKGKTGDNLNRPEFEEMQRAIFNGEIKTVVVQAGSAKPFLEGWNQYALRVA